MRRQTTSFFLHRFVPAALIIIAVCALQHGDALAQAPQPKREFRAVWIASVSNIDFPLSRFDTPDKQRADFIRILDAHRAMGINAVFVQVRPAADALYAKSREPWSYWLTGKQGQAPEPLWDPLQFMIDEVHKRGMEFHAWFNPFRSVPSSTSDVADSHISKTRPDWHLTYANPFKLLDPGKPEVRQYVASVVMDVVRGYDIDGVHFDDYFYPYGGTASQDLATFQQHNRGFTDAAAWRRDNVNLFVQQMMDSINATKPRVKFGISPFGIWKSGTPAGTSGLNAYDVIYCDALAWLQAKSVDYILPQLYWKFGGGQDYGKLMPWWFAQAKQAERHLYTGLAAYRLSPTEAGGNWAASDILPQIEANRAQGVHGSSFFSSNHLTSGLKGLNSELQNGLFKTLALPPTMPWKDNVPPLAPATATARTIIGGLNRVVVSWRRSEKAADGETASRYAVYRFLEDAATNIENPLVLIALTSDTTFTDVLTVPEFNRATYVVTAFDHLWNESAATARVAVSLTNVHQSRSTEIAQLSELAPNPASETATLHFQLAAPTTVSLVLTDVFGREVFALAPRTLPTGSHSETISVANLPQGVYICRFVAGAFAETRKLIVTR